MSLSKRERDKQKTMPFRLIFKVIESGKLAPMMTTDDRALAYAEVAAQQRAKGPLGVRLLTEVTPVELTNSERYVWLVYRVRKAMRQYFDHGRRKEDLEASLQLEKELDGWNTRTRFYLQGHPKSQHDEKALAFFEVVEEWRKLWRKYIRYKKQPDKEVAVEREMKKQCFAVEREIDKYVKLVIGL